MRKAIFILLVSLFVSGAFAQNPIEVRGNEAGGKFPIILRPGFRIGINMSNLAGSDASDRKYIPGIVAGGTFETQFNPWFSTYLDVLFSNQGYKVKGSSAKEVISFVNFPLMANFYIFDKFSVKIGIQPSIMVYASYNQKGENRVNTKDDWRRFSLTVPIGVSYFIANRIEIDLRYGIGLTKINRGNDNMKLRNSVFTVSAAYKFNITTGR